MTSDVLAKFMDQLLTAYATLVILNYRELRKASKP